MSVTPSWAVEFYESDEEGCPVEEFLDELDKPQRAKERYRLLYFGGPKRTFVLLHALSKSTAKVPEGDIELAEERMKRYLEENDRGKDDEESHQLGPVLPEADERSRDGSAD